MEEESRRKAEESRLLQEQHRLMQLRMEDDIRRKEEEAKQLKAKNEQLQKKREEERKKLLKDLKEKEEAILVSEQGKYVLEDKLAQEKRMIQQLHNRIEKLTDVDPNAAFKAELVGRRLVELSGTKHDDDFSALGVMPTSVRSFSDLSADDIDNLSYESLLSLDLNLGL